MFLVGIRLSGIGMKERGQVGMFDLLARGRKFVRFLTIWFFNCNI